MKTAIYIEDGVVQLVLTPESDWEKNTLGAFGDNGIKAEIFTGAFYDCRGGWTRQASYAPELMGRQHSGLQDRSLILRMSNTMQADLPMPNMGAKGE